MKGVVGILGVAIIILMLGAIMLAIAAFRGTPFTEPHIVITDGATAQTTIVLANDVLDDSTTNVNITSPNPADAPVPFTYTSNNRQLTVTGLAISTTRTLSLVYKVPSLDPFSNIAAKFFPAFLILGILAIIGGIIYGAVQNARGG